MFVTDDEALLDELLRLAAAAGVTPDVARDGVGGLRGWSAASLVLGGADQAGGRRRGRERGRTPRLGDLAGRGADRSR